MVGEFPAWLSAHWRESGYKIKQSFDAAAPLCPPGTAPCFRNLLTKYIRYIKTLPRTRLPPTVEETVRGLFLRYFMGVIHTGPVVPTVESDGRDFMLSRDGGIHTIAATLGQTLTRLWLKHLRRYLRQYREEHPDVMYVPRPDVMCLPRPDVMCLPRPDVMCLPRPDVMCLPRPVE